MITFALLSPNDAITVIFIIEKNKDVDFKCSVAAQLRIICLLGCYLCLPKPCGQSESRTEIEEFLCSYLTETMCVCICVLMCICVCVSANRVVGETRQV